MYSLAAPSRVRVSGPADESIVIQVNPLALVVDIRAPADQTAIEQDVFFPRPSPKFHSEATEIGWHSHGKRMDSVRELLHSSFLHLSLSNRAVADLRDSIQATLRAIRESQQLIANSDEIIVRAQFGSRAPVR